MMRSLVLLGFAALALVASAKKDEDEKKEIEMNDEEKWMVTKTVFFDFSIDLDEDHKRVVIALFGEAAPNAANNFAALAKGNYRGDVSEASFLEVDPKKKKHSWNFQYFWINFLNPMPILKKYINSSGIKFTIFLLHIRLAILNVF